MQLSIRGFLIARFIALVAWAALLFATYLTYDALAANINSDVVRLLTNLAMLAAAIWLGYIIQRRVLQWLDPDGELRRQVREQSKAPRHEP